MAVINKKVTVNASLEQVFDYVKEPRNWLEFLPGLTDVRDVRPLPNGGYSAKYHYKMAGVRFSCTAIYTKFIPNQWIVIETIGGIKSTLTLTFRTIAAHETQVTLTIDYRIPVPLLGRLAEVVILKINEQEAALMLANIKARFMHHRYRHTDK